MDAGLDFGAELVAQLAEAFEDLEDQKMSMSSMLSSSHNSSVGQILLNDLDVQEGEDKQFLLPGKISIRMPSRTKVKAENVNIRVNRGNHNKEFTVNENVLFKEQQASTPLVATLQRIPVWKRLVHANAGTFYNLLLAQQAIIFTGVAVQVSIAKGSRWNAWVHTVFVECSAQDADHLERTRKMANGPTDHRPNWLRKLHDHVWLVRVALTILGLLVSRFVAWLIC